MIEQVEGVVIKVNDYSDNDKILALFSDKHGKINVIAKGARKNKSKNLSCCQLFVEGSYHLYRGKKMYTLNSCDLVNANYKIRENLYAFAYTNLICELMVKLLPDEDAHANIYQMLHKTLGYMEQSTDETAQICALAFTIKLIAMIGYKIQLKECTCCGEEINLKEPLGFSILEGGVVCAQCQKHTDLQLKVSVYQTLYQLLYYRFEELSKIEYNKEIMSMVQSLIVDYLYYHSGISNLKSLDFIHSL